MPIDFIKFSSQTDFDASAHWYVRRIKLSKCNSITPTALLSVYDKTNLLDLAKGLQESGVRLLGSGGTAKKIRDAGIPIEFVFFHIVSNLRDHIPAEMFLISQKPPKC